jgi:hypothetical protein
MKLPKKVYLASAALLFVGGGVTALVLMPDSPKEVTVKQTAAVSAPNTETDATDAPDQKPAEQVNSTPSQSTETAPPEPEQPKYGEDPNNPGVFVVFDKTAVMTEAGVSTDDYNYVDKILRGWIYKGSSPSANLCQAYPATKMQSFGADYPDNPITQLKWCNDYVAKRYGTWAKAADYFDVNKGI